MNQAEFARKLGVTGSAVSLWISGKSRMSIDNAKKLRGMTGKLLDDLLDMTPAELVEFIAGFGE